MSDTIPKQAYEVLAYIDEHGRRPSRPVPVAELPDGIREAWPICLAKNWLLQCTGGFVLLLLGDAALAQWRLSPKPRQNGPASPPAERRTEPMAKVELTRRLLNKPNARADKSEALLKRHGLRCEAGNRWTLSLDGLDAAAQERLKKRLPAKKS